MDGLTVDQMSPIRLCLFASTPEIEQLGFIVKVLTGSLPELAETAVAWGYDGIEFLPDPESVIETAPLESALREAGACMPVVNTGRMGPQKMALLHEDTSVRLRSIGAFKQILDLAGYFNARVGMGIARGGGISGSLRSDMDSLASEVFHELAEYAEQVGAVVMLEPADPGVTAYINTMDEAMGWVKRIASPAFTVMLDTYQLAKAESSIEHGIRAAHGEARHIHFYDPNRWPPGVLPEGGRLDWPQIGRALKKEKFNGSGSVVLAPKGDPEPPARLAVAFLRRLLHTDGGE